MADDKGPIPLTVGYDRGTGALTVGVEGLDDILKEAEPADPDPAWTDPEQEGWHIGPLGRGKGQYGPLVKVVLLNGAVWRGELVEGLEKHLVPNAPADAPVSVVMCLHKAEMLTEVVNVPVWQKTYWPVMIPRTSVAWWTKTSR